MSVNDLINALKDLHIPVILVGASILFFLIALVGGGIKGVVVEVPPITKGQRKGMFFFAVLFFILGIFTASVPSSPTTSHAVPQSETPTPTPSSYHFVVNADQDFPGLNTGIDLTVGEHLTIKAQGLAAYGVGSRTSCNSHLPTDPDGQRFLNGTLCPMRTSPSDASPSSPVGELLANIGSPGRFFAVGSSYSTTVSTSGRLYLLYNDVPGAYSDNSGNYQVTITVTVP